MTERSPRSASPSAQSGSSTNLNTPQSPRSPTPDQAQVANDDPAQANPSPKSSTSGESQHDIQPTWPKSIDVTKIKAVAVWGDSSLPNLLLDFHWHPESHKAFFKFRATVALAGAVGRRDGRTSIFIHVHPERIRQLSVDPDPNEKMLGAETLLLGFEMDRPPALVTPTTPCEPKNRSAAEVMDACRGLAGQRSFKVYAHIPRKKMALKRIRELCAAATGAGLSSLVVHASTASLYQGTGGQVIEGDTLTRPVHESPVTDEPPPQYSEPPPADLTSATPIDPKGKKRRRVESSSPEPTEPPSLKAIQALLDLHLSSLKKDLDDQLASQKKDIAALLDKAEARIIETLRGEMDDRCNGVHEDVLQRVHEEMAEVEDNVMRNLSEAPMTATLTFPQHPWY